MILLNPSKSMLFELELSSLYCFSHYSSLQIPFLLLCFHCLECLDNLHPTTIFSKPGFTHETNPPSECHPASFLLAYYLCNLHSCSLSPDKLGFPHFGIPSHPLVEASSHIAPSILRNESFKCSHTNFTLKSLNCLCTGQSISLA